MAKILNASKDTLIAGVAANTTMSLGLEKNTSPEEEDRKWRLIGIGLLIVFITVFAIFLLVYLDVVKPALMKPATASIISSIVALVLTAMYYFAFRFYEDRFYSFISIGWFCNALYIPSDMLFKGNEFAHAILAYWLALISSGAHFLAVLVPAPDVNPNPAVGSRVNVWWLLLPVSLLFNLLTLSWYGSLPGELRSVFLANIIIGIAFSVFALFKLGATIKDGPGQAPVDSLRPITVWLVLLALSLVFNALSLIAYKSLQKEPELTGRLFLANSSVGMLFSAYVLFKLGTTIRDRLGDEVDDKLRWHLALSFYLYGLLQFIYPFKLHLWNRVFTLIFIVAATTKLWNIKVLLRVLGSVTYPKFMEVKKELEVRDKFAELGAMAASIEHDLKTPLSIMNFSINEMKDRFQANPEVIKGLAKIEDSRNRIAATAKIIPYLTGDKEYYDRDRLMAKTSIVELVNRAMRSVKLEMNIDSNKIFFDLNRKHLFIRAFAPMIEQVLVNIFKNSVEAIHEAGKDRGLIQINISSLVTDDSTYSKWVKVEIKDNGRGIAPDKINLVTRMYTDRADKKPNSGIGLFIGSKLMDIHEGKIEIQSKLGEWTTVTLLFPDWESIPKQKEIKA